MPSLSHLENKPRVNIVDIAVQEPTKLPEFSLGAVATPEWFSRVDEKVATHKGIEPYLDKRSQLAVIRQAVGYTGEFFTLQFEIISDFFREEGYPQSFHFDTNSWENTLKYFAQTRQIYGNQFVLLPIDICNRMFEFAEKLVQKFSTTAGHWDKYEPEYLVYAFTAFPSLHSSFQITDRDVQRIKELADDRDNSEEERLSLLAQLRLLDPTFRLGSAELVQQLKTVRSNKTLNSNPHWYTTYFANLAILSADETKFTDRGIELIFREETEEEESSGVPPTQRSF